MGTEDIFTLICKDCKLGALLRVPEQLVGGLMHRMYSINTSSGDYAIKLLNPSIMTRGDALNNYATAERLETVLEQAGIPIVSALVVNGAKMQKCNNQYYYLYNLVEGKVLKPSEIKQEHCAIVGGLLARIHNIDRKSVATSPTILDIDWEHYITLSTSMCPEITKILRDNISILNDCQQDSNIAYNNLPEELCICHNDMDSKNIMWHDGSAKIVDLECLCYKNPYIELYELLLSWSGCDNLDIDYQLFDAMIYAYIAESDACNIDLSVMDCCNSGKLLWLEYNIKRALGIECNDETDRITGINQVDCTTRSIVYYYTIKEQLINRLKNLSVMQ